MAVLVLGRQCWLKGGFGVSALFTNGITDEAISKLWEYSGGNDGVN